MPLVYKIKIKILIIILALTSYAKCEEIKKMGKFKDWQVLSLTNESGKVCFAQSMPVLQSPKTIKREARLFVSFRPVDNCLLYTSPSPRDLSTSRMPSSA